MKIDQITTGSLMLDHSDQDYLREESHLLIGCSGHYSIAELEYKISLLREAEKEALTPVGALSEEEDMIIRKSRGFFLTGYPLHTTKDNKSYFWPMGEQPQDPLTHTCPVKAAYLFLAKYKRYNGQRDYEQPELL